MKLNTLYSPGILQYISFFYVIWSDDLLSYSETAVVRRAIDEDASLSNEDKVLMLQWMDRNAPPANSILKNWKQTISNSKVKLIENETYPLTSFSQKVTQHYCKECTFNPHLKTIEINLGIQPNHYNHLFDVDVIQEVSSDFYDAEYIDKLLIGEEASAVAKIRSTLKDPLFNWKERRDKAHFRDRVLEQVKFLAQKGYGAMAYPEVYGGTEDLKSYAKVFEHLMFVNGSFAVKFGVQFGLFGGSIQKLGTKLHHDKYLEQTGTVELLGCFAMTETGHGSNVRGVKTTATYDKESDQIVIHTPGNIDNKEYIGNALDSKMASVFAQLIVEGKNEGVHAILVPLRDENHKLMPGVRVEDNGYKIGLNGVDNGKIWFDQVKVPRENLLNKYGNISPQGKYTSPIENPNKRFFTMLGTLVGGRICVARAGLGAAKKALAIAVKYALKRRQFNDSIKIREDLLMDYPSHQLRLTPAIAASYVYDVTLSHIMKVYSDASETDKRQVETQVAGLKSLITWFGNETLQECREACGGKGYLLENHIGDLRNDADIFATFEGDNTVLLQLAAKGVLSDFKSEFNGPGFTSVLKLLSTQLSDKLATFNLAFVNKVDAEHLYDPNFHKDAFEYRRRRLTYTLAMRIRDYIKKGMPSYQAFLKVQTHVLALGKAYSVELAYKTFTDFTKTIENEKYQHLFQKLGALYALHELRKDATWYLEQGYISGTKSKALRQRVERLCTELRPHIAMLVDGFGIPEHCMNVDIV